MLKRTISIILAAIIMTAALLSSIPAYSASTTNRIYFFNVAQAGVSDGDMILIQSGNRFGLIDSGLRYKNTIQDADGTVYNIPQSSGLSTQTRYKSGRDVIDYAVSYLGLEHLDFIVATHAHSDHIGGIPEIAACKNQSGSYLVDNKTAYFYKEYKHVNDRDDDLVRHTDTCWHNQAFAYQAKMAMQNRGANLIDVSEDVTVNHNQPKMNNAEALRQMAACSLDGADWYYGASDDYYDDYLRFSFGGLTIQLFNLYHHATSRNENVNSISALITDGTYHFVTTADLNVEDYAEQKVATAIAAEMNGGRADLYKVAHHGSDEGSNAKETMDILKPANMVTTREPYIVNGKSYPSQLTPIYQYCKSNYQTVLYEAGESKIGLAATFTENGFAFHELDGANLVSAQKCIGDLPLSSDTVYCYWYSYWGSDYNDDVFMAYHYTGGKQTLWTLRNYRWCYLTSEAARWQTDLRDDAKLPAGTYVTGWQLINGVWYYFREDGALRESDGWVNRAGYWLYMRNGNEVTGWQKIDGVWYYFRPNGRMHTGKLSVKGDIYYLNRDGSMFTGWMKENGYWYYYDTDGRMRTGWVNDGGMWYYCDTNGAMQTGWKYVGNRWYFLKGNGAMVTGWQKLSGVWYYFSSSGAMLTGWVKDSGLWYYLNASGTMRTGWLRDKNNWYYLNPNGSMRTSWLKYNGQWYYLNSNGAMRTDAITLSGITYYFDGNGACMNP